MYNTQDKNKCQEVINSGIQSKHNFTYKRKSYRAITH